MLEQQRLATVARQQDEAARVYAVQKAAYEQQQQAYVAQFAMMQAYPPAAVAVAPPHASPPPTSFPPPSFAPPLAVAPQPALFAGAPVPPYASTSTGVPLPPTPEKVVVPLAKAAEKGASPSTSTASSSPLPTDSPLPADLVPLPPSPEPDETVEDESTSACAESPNATAEPARVALELDDPTPLRPPADATALAPAPTRALSLTTTRSPPAESECVLSPPMPLAPDSPDEDKVPSLPLDLGWTLPDFGFALSFDPPVVVEPLPARASSPPVLGSLPCLGPDRAVDRGEEQGDEPSLDEAFEATTAYVRRYQPRWPADAGHEARMGRWIEQQRVVPVRASELPTNDGDARSDEGDTGAECAPTLDRPRTAPPSTLPPPASPSFLPDAPDRSALFAPRDPARSRSASPARTNADDRDAELRRRALAALSDTAFGPGPEDERELKHELSVGEEHKAASRATRPLPIPPASGAQGGRHGQQEC